MSLNYLKTGEFHVTQSAGHGVCFVCHSRKQSPHEGIFRGPMIEYEGNLDICVSCIRRAAEDLGMITSDRAEKLHTALTELTQLNEELEKGHEELQRAIDALREAPAPTRRSGRAKVKA